ncbi:MAG: pitrilysin family protein [Myxococcota bacterium]
MATFSELPAQELAPGLPIRRFRAENGLRLYLLVDRSAPVVSYQTWFGVGSRHEQPGKTGLAHLFEHLMFKATKNYGPGEFDRLLEAAGAETNAATWTDWTCYYENLPARKLPVAVALESDRMQHLVLNDEQVASEREVVANERRYTVDDDVEGTVGERLYAMAFERHPYRWPTIGWMEDIHGFTVEDCLGFYDRYYSPANASLVVVGDVDEEETLALIGDAYGHIQKGAVPNGVATGEPVQSEERRARLEQPTDTAKLSVGYRGVEYGHFDHAVVTVLNEILCGGRSSRLFRRFVTDGELATEASASIAPFRDPGLYDFWVSARPGIAPDQLLEVLDEELAKLRSDGVLPSELQKAKNRLELSFLSGLETASGKADQIGFSVAVLDQPAFPFVRLEEYRRVAAEDIRRVAETVLDDAHRSVLLVDPAA